MGKRGPLPKSTALKIQSGVIPVSKEGAVALSTQFEPPKIPKHFRKEERAIWRATVELLKAGRVLERIDQAVLGAYCDSYVKWQKAERELQRIESELGVGAMLITVGASFTRVANPLLAISRKAQADMVSYASQMGMTPSARLRVQVISAAPKTNPFERLKATANECHMDADSKGLRQIIDAQSEQG
jgi:P27 family predicted phage terminase small subunit